MDLMKRRSYAVSVLILFKRDPLLPSWWRNLQMQMPWSTPLWFQLLLWCAWLLILVVLLQNNLGIMPNILWWLWSIIKTDYGLLSDVSVAPRTPLLLMRSILVMCSTYTPTCLRKKPNEWFCWRWLFNCFSSHRNTSQCCVCLHYDQCHFITDGHIFLETELCYRSFCPAINMDCVFPVSDLLWSDKPWPWSRWQVSWSWN